MLTKDIKDLFSATPAMTAFATPRIIALVEGELKFLPSSFLQQFALITRNGINLDTDKIPGIFALSSCTGTRPSVYGVVINLVDSSDVYQIAIGNNNELFFRINVNNNIFNWKKVSSVATVIGSGGGKLLFLNKLRNIAERRVA